MARSHPGSSPGLIDEAAAILRRARRRLRERRCRLIARPRMVDERRAVVTMLEGQQVFVDRTDRGLSQSLIAHGYWEMWLTEAVEAMIRPGMVTIDIGANVGYFALLMADRVGSGGRVHAFEPNPEMGALLAESVAANGLSDRLTLHDDPVWDSDGAPVVLHVPEGEPKNAHVGIGGADDGLRTRRLDGFPDLLAADLIKIDVEGAEEHVWRGMAGLFAQGRALTIFLEFTPVRYVDAGAFLDAIAAEGFALSELSVSHGVRPVSRAEILAGDPREDRMLALVRPDQRRAA